MPRAPAGGGTAAHHNSLNSRGATIIKHPVETTDAAGKVKWTGPRVPLCEVNRELIRLLGAADAAPIAAQLAALQPGERAAKVRPRATPITGIPQCLSGWNRQPSAGAAPLTDKQIASLSDEEFARASPGHSTQWMSSHAPARRNFTTNDPPGATHPRRVRRAFFYFFEQPHRPCFQRTDFVKTAHHPASRAYFAHEYGHKRTGKRRAARAVRRMQARESLT